MTDRVTLARRISLPLLIFYGVGTMVGGGFYALVGKVAGIAGLQAPFCMLLAALLALFSALSFAELASRFPVSAGESYYMERAFHIKWIAVVIGWLVIVTGVVSAATLSNAIVQFLLDTFDFHRELGIVVTVMALGAIAAWGIGESLLVTVVITVIEVAGLLYVIAVAGGSYGEVGERWGEIVPSMTTGSLGAIGVGGFLVFYGYLGFEDMVNVSEEVERPRRNLPIAIFVSLGVTALLYFAVSLAAVLTVPAAELAASRNPLAEVVARSGAPGRAWMVPIGVLAGVNGALVQIIMASRVAYGMSDKGLGPKALARVHPRTRTPLRATALVIAIVLALALLYRVVTLAQLTSGVILIVFASVNFALFVLKGRDSGSVGEGPRFPRWVPLVGFLTSVGFLLFRIAQ